MIYQETSTFRQINYITRLQNNPLSQDAVRRYLESRGKKATNSLTRGEASDLIKLLLYLRQN